MADDQQELRRVSWTEVFGFTHVFKSFRMAVHPSKLALGLGAIVLVFLLGQGMDLVWKWMGKTAWDDSVNVFYSSPNTAAYQKAMKAHKDGLPLADWYRKALAAAADYQPFVQEYASNGGGQDPGQSYFWKRYSEQVNAERRAAEQPPASLAKDVTKNPGDVFNKYEKKINSMLDDLSSKVEQAGKDARKDIDGLTGDGQTKAQEQFDKDLAGAAGHLARPPRLHLQALLRVQRAGAVQRAAGLRGVLLLQRHPGRAAGQLPGRVLAGAGRPRQRRRRGLCAARPAVGLLGHRAGRRHGAGGLAVSDALGAGLAAVRALGVRGDFPAGQPG